MSARLYNRTRRTHDLLAKFRRERQWHFIPLFHLFRLSDFAREGIENSGSYRFADHMYRNVPSGRGWLGRRIDRLLLDLTASRSMRSRCAQATSEMRRALKVNGDRPFRILTVPCGLPRDVRDLTRSVASSRIQYIGLDLDPAVLVAAKDFMSGVGITCEFVCCDALERETWPPGEFDFISSTGFGEFLTDGRLAEFYANVHAALRPGGVFFTSAAAREPRSDWLMKAFEFHAHYRTSSDLAAVVGKLAWRSIDWSHDEVGLQTFVRTVKA